MNNLEAAMKKVGDLMDSIYVQEGDEGFFARSNISEDIGGFGEDELSATEDCYPQCYRLAGFRWIEGAWHLND